MSDELRPYPEYRESGVAWLGKVPAHWEVRRQRHVAELRVSNVDKHTHEGEIPVRLCNYVDVYKRERITESVPFMRATANAGEIAAFRLRIGDVLITKDSESWDDIAVPALVEYAAQDLVCGYHLAILRPRDHVLFGAFLLRALQSQPVATQLHVAANGVTRYGLSQGGIKNALLPVPPRAEQDAIARYLDVADRRIRRYIHAKQRLIAVLDEQKQLIVHRAVTRGLDPEMPLKPSGVDWLGDVPAHWRVLRLRHAVEMVVSNVDKLTTPGEEPVRLCNYVDVYKNERITDDLAFMAATATHTEVARFRVRVGDVLITKDSEVWNDIGVPALVEHEALDLVCGYHLAMLRPRPSVVLGAFLLRALQSRAVATQLHVGANGVTRYGLTQATIKDALVAVPPKDEQAAIVRRIDAELTAIRAASRRASEEIVLLREYRTRLVADVVTGKLDVRAAAARLPNEYDEPDVVLLDDAESPDEDVTEDASDLEPAEA